MAVFKFNQRIDPITKAAAMIDVPHFEVHEGEAFSWYHTASVASGATYNCIVVTPNTSLRAHMKFGMQTSLAGTGILNESAAASGTGGTLVTSFNCDRNATNTSGLVFRVNSTLTSTGTNLAYTFVGGGANPSTRVGGAARSEYEYILKQNTTYALQLIAATNLSYIVEAEWYEED